MSLTVYCYRSDRLGARLKNFLHALIFSKKLHANLIVNWSPGALGLALDRKDSHCIDHDDYQFFDLFDKANFDSDFPHISITSHNHFEMEELLVSIKGQTSLKISEVDSQKISYFVDGNRTPILFDITRQYSFLDDTTNRKHKEIENIFKLLPLHPSVRNALDLVIDKLDLRNALCIHVRRGDLMNVTDIAQSFKNNPDNKNLRKRLLNSIQHLVNRYAPNHAYDAAIEELGANRKLVIFSDDSGVKKRFLNDYGGHCLEYDHLLESQNLTVQQRDFVEFLIIAHCGEIVGTESAFVDFSSQLGGKSVKNVLAFIDVQQFVTELKSLFAIDSSNNDLLKDILELYLDSFSRRNPLMHKSEELSDIMLALSDDN